MPWNARWDRDSGAIICSQSGEMNERGMDESSARTKCPFGPGFPAVVGHEVWLHPLMHAEGQ
jgi:hypothetical protein